MLKDIENLKQRIHIRPTHCIEVNGKQFEHLFIFQKCI